MRRIYLDIETYRPKQEDMFVDEKIIAIGILIEHRSMEREIILKVWEMDNEEALVRTFYNIARTEIFGYAELIGFNIMRFDIPILKQKALEYCIMQLAELNMLWDTPFTIDLFQICLILNGMRYRGNSLENWITKAKELGYNVPETYGSGGEVAKWYEAGEYDKIEQHLRMDLYAIKSLYGILRDSTSVLKILHVRFLNKVEK